MTHETLTDLQRVQRMNDANWTPANTYWRERAQKAEAALEEARRAAPAADDLRVSVPKTLTAAQLADACMSYRHDYGLMDVDLREDMRREAAEWWRCFERTLNDPTAALRDAQGGASK